MRLRKNVGISKSELFHISDFFIYRHFPATIPNFQSHFQILRIESHIDFEIFQIFPSGLENPIFRGPLESEEIQLKQRDPNNGKNQLIERARDKINRESQQEC